MAIVYYPTRVYKKYKSPIDNLMEDEKIQIVSISKDLSGEALDEYVSANGDWQNLSVQFTFNNVVSKSYGALVANGRKVVADLNNYLWFQCTGTLWQRIVLDAGFYGGDEIALHLQTKLNANTAFTAVGLTFVVAYDSTSGLFTITPSSGQIKFIQSNYSQPLRYIDSIAGHLFGFTATTNFANSIQSDTPCYGLNDENYIINEIGSTATSHYHDDIHYLSVDQAIHIFANVSNCVSTSVVSFKNL